MGAISSLKAPASLALAQRSWLWSAYWSHISRVMPYFSARFSAVMPMGVGLGTMSVRAAMSESTSLRSTPNLPPPKRTPWSV